MSLTVPQAGVSGGAVARPQVAEPSRFGAGLAGLGQTMSDLGNRMERQRLDLELSRVQVDMTRDLNNLRLKYDQMGDPDAIEQGWGADIKELRDAYLPKVDAANRDQFLLGFDQLANSNAFALGQGIVALRQSQNRATIINYQATAANAVAGADAGTAETLYGQHRERLDAAVARGDISPEDAAKQDLAFRQNGDFDRAANLLKDNPAALRSELDAGTFQYLTPDQKSRLEAGLTSAAEKALLLADKQKTEAAKAATADLRDGAQIMKRGLPWRGEDMLDDPSVKAAAPDAWAEARGAQALRDGGRSIEQMTVDQLKKTRAEIVAPGFDKPWQTEMVSVLDSRIADQEKAWVQDGVAAGKASELDVPDLPDFDPSDPAAFTKALNDRVTWADWAEERGYAPKVGLLDSGERARLKQVLDVNSDPSARAAALVALSDGAGSRAVAVAKSAGASDAAIWSIGLMRNGMSSHLTEAILRGETKAAKKTVILPPPDKMTLAFDEMTAGLFEADPIAKSAILKTATALYADSAAEGSGGSDWGSDDDVGEGFDNAIQQVLGGTPDPGTGDYTVGGIQSVGGQSVILPPGLSAAAANRAWRNLDNQLKGREWSEELADWPRGDPATTDVLRGLKAASLGGKQVPNLGEDPWEVFRQGMQIVSFGVDQYALRYERSGRWELLENTDGKTFTFSMRGLVDGTAR